jgi:hypothetical protein
MTNPNRLVAWSSIVAGLLLASFVSSLTLAQSPSGQFIGTLILKDEDPEGQTFTLGAPFGYLDPKGTRWDAKEGLVFDGASIPRALWTVVGSPYTGSYRRAAVLHDYYCYVHSRTWQDVHHMFYDAMLTGGVGKAKANLMFYAVWRFAKRWEIRPESDCKPDSQGHIFCPANDSLVTTVLSVDDKSNTEQSMVEELNDVRDKIEKDDVSAEDVISLANSQHILPRKSEKSILRDPSRFIAE